MAIAGLFINDDSVRQALREVIDPELGENLVDLGLVYGIATAGTEVVVDLTLTTPSCPLHASLHGAAERAIRSYVPGVETVDVRLVFDPPWCPDRMTPEAKRRLGFC